MQTAGQRIDTSKELESWYRHDNGQYLLDTTRRALQALLDTSFGYHILQMGRTRGHPLFEDCPINHRIYAADQPGQGITLLARSDELPLEGDSIDTVIAHHSLEFVANPHQVLREIQRVLTPQGQLLIIGFNPYSLFGINTRLRGLNRRSLWHHHHPVSERRLTDWLHLLGCEVQSSTRLYGLPPFGRGRIRRGLMSADRWSNRHNLPSGGLYILHAIKQVSAVHRPRRQRRLSGERLIGLVPKPRPSPSPTPRAGAVRPKTVSPRSFARRGNTAA